MNAAKAKRRWMQWGRYVAATGTVASTNRHNWGGIHAGQMKAYSDAMHARRYAPRGRRVVWYRPWMDSTPRNLRG